MSFAAFEEDDERTLLEKAEKLQSGYIAQATQDGGDIDAVTFARLRQEIMTAPALVGKVPDFVRRCRDKGQFWQFIKNKFRHYQERREFIWNEFRPVLEFLETQDRTPGVAPISEALEGFDPDNVKAAWQKALDRRATDPEGAITAARMLLETVCKHILDEVPVVTYADDADLPKLWALTAETLNLAPSQHQEPVFRAILGNCQSVVNHLGAIRNKIGDAHGQGRRPVKPKARHAELAVNLGGNNGGVSGGDMEGAAAVTPDPKWLEILKASGWQTTALAAAFGVILLVIRLDWFTLPDPWFTVFCALAFLICLFLALASIGHAVADFLQPRMWLAHWAQEKQHRKEVREYIPFMTDHEKAIIAYLLHRNQKTFTAASDGGYAATLISRRIVVPALVQGQMFSGEDMPLAIPDHVWDVLAQHREQFPYTVQPRRDGVEPHPWRVPWMAR